MRRNGREVLRPAVKPALRISKCYTEDMMPFEQRMSRGGGAAIEDVAVEIERVSYVGLVPLIELKLASGISNPGRVKDLGDVQELIRVLKLPGDSGEN
jgi:hypothetical protein